MTEPLSNLGKTVEEILTERGSKYNKNGTYYDHSDLSQCLKERVRQHPGWQGLDSDMKESIDMVLHKTARILNGDPKYLDNWQDIEGYTRLVVQRLQSQA